MKMSFFSRLCRLKNENEWMYTADTIENAIFAEILSMHLKGEKKGKKKNCRDNPSK